MNTTVPDYSIQNLSPLVRNIKNAVLKEYLCHKKPKLLTNLVTNNFPVPRDRRPKNISFIDVDAISTDTCNSLTDERTDSKSPPNSITPPNVTQNESTFGEGCNSTQIINESFINILLNERELMQNDHYSKF